MHRALKGSQNPCLSTACTSGLCFSNTTDRNTKLSVPLARLARHSCQDDSHTWLLCTQAHRGQSQSTHILLPAQDSHPAPLAWGAHPGPSAAPVSHPAGILLGAGAQGWHRCSGALFAIPCEPSWGFHGSTGTPRHHFHRNSQQSSWHCLHGGAQAVPSLCHPHQHHQPHAGTDGWSGDSVAQPLHASSQRGFLGVQPALAVARSPPRVAFHGMAARPASLSVCALG